MLQNFYRWMASAVALFALVALGGDARLDTASASQSVAISAADAEVVRATVISRAWIRVELADASAAESPATAEPSASEPQPEPVPPPVVAVAPAPAPARVAPPAQPVKPPAATCPANQFCYPRVGIAGNIVPYTDCSGRTDVGTAIRSIDCVSPTYLAAHAYTQFGRITGWRAGDVVFAFGARYVIYDAFTQPSCAPPARAIAPLSLQTSLTPTLCGPVLVVQARPG